MALDLDEIDRTILRLLQENARTANAEIGRTVGLSGQSVQERIRKLEIAGIVRGYEANLNPAALGLEVTAFIEITIPTGRNYDEEYKGISAFTTREPEVLEQHGVAGDIDMILKVRCLDIPRLNGLMNRLHGATRSHTKTIIVLGTRKETQRSPLPGDGAE
ncbi:MAG TPA: Lrp/AsnC family transcriptional regulator [Thermomicrobiales bacterium]|jgi:DNA-binding Lrp family transcriptional regulator